MQRYVRVVPYDPEWPARYAHEAELVRGVLGDVALSIHHVGSTAVPGLIAKPVIDIMVVVAQIEQVDAYNDALAEIGYVARGEAGIPGRRHFNKGGDEARTHNMHIYGVGHPEIARHLNFVAYLAAHPEAAEAYGRLKVELARRFPEDIMGYNESKTDFILEADRMALEWLAGRSAG